MNNGQLTAKQKMFCEEYLLDFNATQAAIRAGYSKRSAASMGEENMRKHQIAKRIHHLLVLRNMKTRIKAERVVQELAKIAFAKDGVKTSDRIKALGMLAKLMGLFGKQTSQSPGLTLEDNESEIPLNGIFREDWQIYDAMTPIERGRIFGALDKYFDKKAI